MTKLTAANSPLLHVVKDEVNKQIFKAASIIANLSGEAAVVDYLMQYLTESAQPAARKRYTALIAGNSELLDTIRDWYGKDLFRIAALEYAKDGENAAIDVVCGARCHSQAESERLRLILNNLRKPTVVYVPGDFGNLAASAPKWGEYATGEKLIVSPNYVSDTLDDGYHPVFKPGELVTVFKIASSGVEVGYSESVFDRIWISKEMMPLWFDREVWDTRPIEGPISELDLAYFRLIAQAEAHGSPLEYRDFSEVRTLEYLGFIELVDEIKYVPQCGAYYAGFIVTERGLAYLADYTIVPLYSAAPDNEFCIGPLSSWELSQLRGVAANESYGTPTHFRLRHFAYLEDCGFIEYVPRLVWLPTVEAMGGGYIVTERGLAELAEAPTEKPISELARGRVVMAMECTYWRNLYGNPFPFAKDADLYDEICYWRKLHGMPPVNAVPALDKLINDQIDANPQLAAQLGLERR
jgi:hypothetical protein